MNETLPEKRSIAVLPGWMTQSNEELELWPQKIKQTQEEGDWSFQDSKPFCFTKRFNDQGRAVNTANH